MAGLIDNAGLFEGTGVYVGGKCIGHIKNGSLPTFTARVINNDFDGDVISITSIDQDLPNVTLKQLSQQIKDLKDDLAVVKHKGAKELITAELKRVKNEHYKLSQLLQGLNLSKLYGKKKVEVISLDITRQMWQCSNTINVRAAALVNGMKVEIDQAFPSHMVDTVGKARQTIIDCLS